MIAGRPGIRRAPSVHVRTHCRNDYHGSQPFAVFIEAHILPVQAVQVKSRPIAISLIFRYNKIERLL